MLRWLKQKNQTVVEGVISGKYAIGIGMFVSIAVVILLARERYFFALIFLLANLVAYYVVKKMWSSIKDNKPNTKISNAEIVLSVTILYVPLVYMWIFGSV